MPERLIKIQTGKEELEGEYSIKEFEGKDFKVQTVKAQDCNLCGYYLPFRNEIVIRKDGTRDTVGVKYLMRAKDFPELDLKGLPKSERSVLPEIIVKLLRNPPVIRLLETILSEPEEKPKKEDKGKK